MNPVSNKWWTVCIINYTGCSPISFHNQWLVIQSFYISLSGRQWFGTHEHVYMLARFARQENLHRKEKLRLVQSFCICLLIGIQQRPALNLQVKPICVLMWSRRISFNIYARVRKYTDRQYAHFILMHYFFIWNYFMQKIAAPP